MKILVPLSGVQPTRQIAEYIMEIAQAIGATVLAVSIVRPGHALEVGELCLEMMQTAAADVEVRIETELRHGPIVDTIIESAESHAVNLIVLGASDGLIVERWIASEIRDQTKVPVVQIPFQVFVA